MNPPPGARWPTTGIERLRDFVLVVDIGSLTRAAARAGVSQPSMSHRMSQLEHEVGQRLLERGPRGVEPTAAGLELYRGARQVVRQFDQLAETLGAGTRDLRGSVSVGLPSSTAGMLAPELVGLLAARHPRLRLELFESMSGYIVELLDRGRLDVAVVFREPDEPARPGEVPLYSEDLCLVTAAAVDPSAEPVAVPDVAGRPLVVPAARSNLRRLVDRAYAAHGLVPHVVADVESLTAMVRIAQSGRASTVLPRAAVAVYAGPDLALRPFVEPDLRRLVTVSIAPESHEPRLAVVAARDAVVDSVRSLAERGAWPGITPTGPRPTHRSPTHRGGPS